MARPSSSLPGRSTTSSPPLAPQWLLAQTWDRIPTTQRVVALTFDAGGDATGIPSILATLARSGIPATFFMTGTWARRYAALARTIASRYRIANHTMTHPHLTALDSAAVTREIQSGAAQIRAAAGVDPAPWFRFPYGDSDRRTIKIVRSLGYVNVGWTVDTLGWKGLSAGSTPAAVVRRVLAAAQPGEIVLMHVGATPTDQSTPDADALPRLIAQLRARGYSFVTIDALQTRTR